MTKFLKIALGQHHPNFHQGILKINRVSGKHNNDIYFTEKLSYLVRSKLKILSLDPHDTTSEELYFALREKLKIDENNLIRHLRYLAANRVSVEANLADGLILKLNQATEGLSLLSLRAGFLKTRLTKYPLKKTVKALGYRTKSSMFKREPMSLIFLAAEKFESPSTVETLQGELNDVSINDLSYSPVIFKKDIKSRFDLSVNADFKSATIYLNDRALNRKGNLVKLLIEVGEIINTWILKDRVIDFIKFRDDFSVFYDFMLNDVSQHPNEFLDNFVANFNDISLFNTILEDLDLEQTQSPMTRLDNKILHLSNLDFWSDTNYLLNVNHHQVVSFNVKDIVGDMISGVDFAYRSFSNAQQALKKELINQYFSFSGLIEYLSDITKVRTDNLLNEVFVN